MTNQKTVSLCHVYYDVSEWRSLIGSPLGPLATRPNPRSLPWTSCAGILLRPWLRRISAVDTKALHLTSGMSKTAGILSSAIRGKKYLHRLEGLMTKPTSWNLAIQLKLQNVPPWKHNEIMNTTTFEKAFPFCTTGEVEGTSAVEIRMIVDSSLRVYTECSRETHVVRVQPNGLSEQAFQCFFPTERHRDEYLSTNFVPIMYTYDSTHLNGGDVTYASWWKVRTFKTSLKARLMRLILTILCYSNHF